MMDPWNQREEKDRSKHKNSVFEDLINEWEVNTIDGNGVGQRIPLDQV